MNIESRLTELVGDVGKKLHTGRSRNDQVALDFRLFVSDRLREWTAPRPRTGRRIHGPRRRDIRTPSSPAAPTSSPRSPSASPVTCSPMPGCSAATSSAWPTAKSAPALSPLGAAALAGTTYPLDPASAARELDMYCRHTTTAWTPCPDRDFVIEALFCASTAMMHLSSLLRGEVHHGRAGAEQGFDDEIPVGTRRPCCCRMPAVHVQLAGRGCGIERVGRPGEGGRAEGAECGCAFRSRPCAGRRGGASRHRRAGDGRG